MSDNPSPLLVFLCFPRGAYCWNSKVPYRGDGRCLMDGLVLRCFYCLEMDYWTVENPRNFPPQD